MVAALVQPCQPVSDPYHIATRTQELERWLLKEFGPVLNGQALRKLLGLPTPDAFRQALKRRGAPVPLFHEPGRRGWCASTCEVARWIAQTEGEVRTERLVSPNAGDAP